ncbi:MAG: 3-isopropylmalate dehydratase large subunit [Candidatus Omnitrophota bacterium]
MPHTITEKILALHAGKKEVYPGEFLWAKVDLALGNDITSPLAIEEFQKSGAKKVFDANKIALVCDHFIPAKDARSAKNAKILRDFAAKHRIKNFYDTGLMGVEHALLPELGLVVSGNLVIGADSHTCTYGALAVFSTGVGSTDLAMAMVTGRVWLRVPKTIKFIYRGKLSKWVGGKDLILHTIADIGVEGAHYKAMEFCGPVIKKLPMDDRFSMCNMAIEAGGKSGIIEPDEITFRYLKEHQNTRTPEKTGAQVRNLTSDKDAKYSQIKEYDVSKWDVAVACPHLPSNVKPIHELKNIKLDQVVIGSCTNGRISDLRIAAGILKGKKVNRTTRTIIIPATQRIYLEAAKQGLLEIFVKSGAVVSTPTCGPCLGGHCGVLTEGEVSLATTNRNFLGRMGDPKSFVYLSNPSVAAASAIKGRIAHPEEVI